MTEPMKLNFYNTSQPDNKFRKVGVIFTILAIIALSVWHAYLAYFWAFVTNTSRLTVNGREWFLGYAYFFWTAAAVISLSLLAFYLASRLGSKKLVIVGLVGILITFTTYFVVQHIHPDPLGCPIGINC
jgi:hypothetical protein